MNIVIFEAKQRDKAFFNKYDKKDKITYVKEPLTIENAAKYKNAEVVCTFIFSRVTKEVIKALPKLKLVVTRSTGFDHIAGKEAKKKGIVVCNVPQYGANTVAEHTFALILNLSRHVHKSYLRATKDDYKIEDLVGFDLKDKWLGVLGAGHIGQHVIKIAKGFGMHVIAYDQYRNNFLADLLHFTYADTPEEVLKKADIVSLHMPATPETHHFINKKSIAQMKKGAIIINTSRGELIDTDALYDALKAGKIGGAGLDVLEGERFIKEDRALLHEKNPDLMKTLLENKEILKMDNVVFTPHNAFNSKEALHRILEVSLRNIEKFKEKEVINQVN